MEKYRMDIQDVLARIFEFIYLPVTMPNNDELRDAALKLSAHAAIEKARADKELDWYPFSAPYKGKSKDRIGMWACGLRSAWNSQEYAFLFREPAVSKINERARNLWNATIGGNISPTDMIEQPSR